MVSLVISGRCGLIVHPVLSNITRCPVQTQGLPVARRPRPLDQVSDNGHWDVADSYCALSFQDSEPIVELLLWNNVVLLRLIVQTLSFWTRQVVVALVLYDTAC